MKVEDSINIDLNHIREGLLLSIDALKANTLFDAEESASENNEARYQLVEGCFYDYALSVEKYVLGNSSEQIVIPHKKFGYLGKILPNIFVGTLTLPLLDKQSGEILDTIELEVQSVKSSYRDDYRDMLEFITEKCTDLLLQANSPVSHQFEIDYTKDNQALYQKFAFIKSVIGTDEFAEAIHRIVTAPVTQWADVFASKDIRRAKRFSNSSIKEILKGSNRTKLPSSHFLRN